MIKNWYVTGDTHRDFSRFKNYPEEMNSAETAIVILGDAGINFNLNISDSNVKNMLAKRYKFRIYCVRGNHEARPSDVPNMIKVYDEDVGGDIYMESAWPNIRYFLDFGEYTIDNYSVLVLGGAYSVDKNYRLIMNRKWFYNEQLSEEEMSQAMKMLSGKHYDFVFTHTCPFTWEPRDLFLDTISQKSVDKSMELWMNDVKDACSWNVWCFGHYHADRLERPYAEMYSLTTDSLTNISERWKQYKITDELPWHLPKSPQFYWD